MVIIKKGSEILTFLSHYRRFGYWMLFIILLKGIFFLTAINQMIEYSHAYQIRTLEQEIPKAQTALVLGSRVYANSRPSDTLRDRLDTAIELYERDLVEKVLVSGDNGQVEYNEVQVMKDYVLEQGIPVEDVFMDHAGFDTYDSIYRAKEIFQVDSLLIVTQEFHLPRSLYLASRLEIPAYGVIADKQPYIAARYFAFRESLARVKAFADITFSAEPRFLGEIIPITGESSKSFPQ